LKLNNINIETLDPKMNMTKFEYLKKAHTSYNSINQVKEFGFHLIKNPICIINSDKKILIHLKQLNDDDAVVKAKEIIDDYYFYILDHPTY